jgi:3-keto-5-aminohexanoate cleavage enzyme
MDPLMIIATPNNCWMNPNVEYPLTAEAIAEESRLCFENGSTIFHIHGEGKWKATIAGVRAQSPIIVQCGMSSQLIPERMDIFENKSDMISIILNHHDEAFVGAEFNVLHLRAELHEYIRLCQQYGVIPDWEVWHSGSVWNLNHLIDQKLLKPPFATTLFFGWPGGTWSPATVEEYVYRRKMMPEGCVCTVSIMDKSQRDIITSAIINGDHVRVGTEDYPFAHNGTIAFTHELVREVADMARALARSLATVAQAREMVGLKI